MIKIAFLLTMMLFLTGCSQNGRTKLDDQSIWTISRHDDLKTYNFRKIKVRFHDNGYAYEENTILKYPYKVFYSRNTFEFNRKLYTILQWREKESALQNTSTGIVVILLRE